MAERFLLPIEIPDDLRERLTGDVTIGLAEFGRGMQVAIEAASAELFRITLPEEEKNAPSSIEPFGRIVAQIIFDPQAALEYVMGSAAMMAQLLKWLENDTGIDPEEVLRRTALNIASDPEVS